VGVKSRLQALCLANQEIERIQKIITYFTLHQFAKEHNKLPNRREIYQFYHRAGEAGIDAGLLFLAESLVSGGLDLPPEIFASQLNLVRTLFEAWWEQFDTVISPVLYMNGEEIMKAFNILPSPLVGKILSEIKEGQAAGEINSREEALAWAARLINE